MKKRLLAQTMVIFTIFLLIGLGLSPVASSNKIIQQKQIGDTSVNEKDLHLLKNIISNILKSDQIGDTSINEIINFIEKIINNTPSLQKKTIVISQGWSYDINYFKNTRFQIKNDIFSFWHYTQDSKSGTESKTFVMRPDNLMSSRSAELYIGKQIGFMYRPTGLYFFQKNTFPQLSYTIFIGFASYISVSAEEEVELNLPFTLV